MRPFIFLTILFFGFSLAAQRRGVTHNHIGLQASYVNATLSTDNFITHSGSGFLAGLSTRGAFYDDFDLVYGLDFLKTNLDIQASNEAVSYTLSGVQVKLLASYQLAGENLSIELGPALQINGKLELDDAGKADAILDGYTLLQAGDIEEISKVNGMLLAGFTAGIENVRLVARYQYNFTNSLNRLNDEDLQLKDPAATNFKGNIGLITAGIVFYL